MHKINIVVAAHKMPSFDLQILTPPSAFLTGCRSLNSLVASNPAEYARIASRAVAAAKVGNATDADEGDTTDRRNCFRTCFFLANAWSTSSPVPTPKEVAVALDTGTSLSRETIEAFVTTYCENSSAAALSTIIQAGSLSLSLSIYKYISFNLLTFYDVSFYDRHP